MWVVGLDFFGGVYPRGVPQDLAPPPPKPSHGIKNNGYFAIVIKNKKCFC